MRIRWRQGLRVFAVLLLLAVLFAYAMVQGGFVSWFLFYSVSVLLFVGLLFIVFPLRFLNVERVMANRQLAHGETTKVYVNISKKSWWPLLFLGVRDRVPSGLQIESHPGAFFLMLFSKQIEYSYLIKAEKRGSYTYEHVNVETGDPFGFWKRERKLPVKSEVLVYPRITKLPFKLQNIRSKKSTTDRAGVQRFSHEETQNFSSVREYEAGDRLTSIDWKVSARLGRLATKEFDTEEGEGFTILLDGRVNDRQAFEEAVEWAAAAVHNIHEQQSPVNFACLGTGMTVLSAGNDRTHVRKVMNALARVEPSSTDERDPFPTSFRFLPSVIYMIPEMSDSAMKEIRQMQQRHELFVLYSDRETAQLPLKQMRVKTIAMPTKRGRRR
ncbi:DUF58 domain-containing protein [Natribacillus halophilus]|uniref:Uncharacterized conserved protein, DUF58 family, contains vWF domain n=1 Tax=Natribacillus halophilus TaxID=549003 RepID=A0A1G8PDK9_9BACI|nr:DUF58 domain-containing protein [Natribacillus halophilus]SDI90661.1 Uncharacterized conserved protein, DUF58 family, contains vWF domain [Natribacillus halophilus]